MTAFGKTIQLPDETLPKKFQLRGHSFLRSPKGTWLWSQNGQHVTSIMDERTGTRLLEEVSSLFPDLKIELVKKGNRKSKKTHDKPTYRLKAHITSSFLKRVRGEAVGEKFSF